LVSHCAIGEINARFVSFNIREEQRLLRYEMPTEQNHYFKAATTFTALIGFRVLRRGRLAQGRRMTPNAPDANWR